MARRLWRVLPLLQEREAEGEVAGGHDARTTKMWTRRWLSDVLPYFRPSARKNPGHTPNHPPSREVFGRPPRGAAENGLSIWKYGASVPSRCIDRLVTHFLESHSLPWGGGRLQCLMSELDRLLRRALPRTGRAVLLASLVGLAGCTGTSTPAAPETPATATVAPAQTGRVSVVPQ